MKYDVYFEFFGRKMKTTIEASSRQEAERQVRERVHILMIQENEVDRLRNIFGI